MSDYNTSRKAHGKTQPKNLNHQISEICDLTKYKPVFVDVDTNVYNNWLRAFSVLMHTGP
jgi:hypothetical protein